ncbi:cytoplasmic polyadenylation element-binding protein 1-like [Watersipora subatra]|uniref:cytoplasmic polyadenylation element-binding protein 1-like n=1 Tax=Watersipora subatra TaxID=2589382 RepID=UPI00355BF252
MTSNMIRHVNQMANDYVREMPTKDSLENMNTAVSKMNLESKFESKALPARSQQSYQSNYYESRKYPKPADLMEETNDNYSCKVFLGGLAKDCGTECVRKKLMELSGSNNVKIEDKRAYRTGNNKGFLHAIFPRGIDVYHLLENCGKVENNGTVEYFISCHNSHTQCTVEIKPWLIMNNEWGVRKHQNNSTTVFVGGIHSTVTAECLARYMTKFGEVEYVRRDVDKHKYPLGSGCVTFHQKEAYIDAVATGQISVRKMRVSCEIKPYLNEMGPCSNCQKQTPDFCSHPQHLQYYCKKCWQRFHSHERENMHARMSKPVKGFSGQFSAAEVRKQPVYKALQTN